MFYINKKVADRNETIIGIFYGPQIIATIEAIVKPGTDQVGVEVRDSMDELVVRWHDYVEGEE